MTSRTPEETTAFYEACQEVEAFIHACTVSAEDDFRTKPELPFESKLMDFYIVSTRRIANMMQVNDESAVRTIDGWSLELKQISIAEQSRGKRFCLHFIQFLLTIMPHDFLFIQSVLSPKLKEMLCSDHFSDHVVLVERFGGNSFAIVK